MWQGMCTIAVIAAVLYNDRFSSSILKQWVKASSDSLLDTQNMESFNPRECVCYEVLIYLLHGDRTHLNCVCLGRHSSAVQEKVIVHLSHFTIVLQFSFYLSKNSFNTLKKFYITNMFL